MLLSIERTVTICLVTTGIEDQQINKKKKTNNEKSKNKEHGGYQNERI